jgi:hypothetical protein
MGFWGFVSEQTTSPIARLNLAPSHAIPHEAKLRLDCVLIANNLPPYKFVESVK